MAPRAPSIIHWRAGAIFGHKYWYLETRSNAGPWYKYRGTTAPMGHRLMSLHSLPRSLNRQIHKKTRTSQMAKKHLTSNGSSQTLVSLMMPLVMFTMGLQTNRPKIDSSVVYLSAYFCFGIQIDRRNDWTIKLWGPVLLQIEGYKHYFFDDLDTDDVTRCIHTFRCIWASGGSGCSSLCWIATQTSSWSSTSWLP